MKFNDLNPDQLQAVVSNLPHQMIIAGPGTGKTKTLVSRYQYLIDQKKVDPEKIIVITFTNKAADELKDRVGNVDNAQIFTFHGLGYQILSSNLPAPVCAGRQVGTKEESSKVKIIDDAHQFEIINSLIKQFSLSIKAKELILLISKYKNSIDEDDLTNIKKIVSQYQSFLDERKIIDFDDLLVQSIELLESNEKIRFFWKKKIDHLLIDEFQDTNNLQYQLVKMINPAHLFVIGDPLQSIYGFRGANAKIFDQLKNDFSQIEMISLKDHYRCRPEIISASLQLFEAPIPLQSIKEPGGIVQYVKTRNSKTEAKWIEYKIEENLGGSNLISAGSVSKDGKRLKDFAVIFRTRRLAEEFVKHFSASGLPYQLVGQLSPFEKPLIKKLISVFKFLVAGQTERLTMLNLTTSQLRDLTYLAEEKDKLKTEQIVEKIIEYLKLIITDQEKLNLIFVLQSWSQFDNKKNKLNLIVNHFEKLVESNYFDNKVDKISIMTIHAVKGLEFDTVFIGGFEQGLIPIRKAIDAGEIEEEKRLLFVAMTRAKNELYLFQTQYRFGKKVQPSSFLKLIQSSLKMVVDEEIEKWAKKKKKIEDKKRQGSLF